MGDAIVSLFDTLADVLALPALVAYLTLLLASVVLSTFPSPISSFEIVTCPVL